MAGWIVLGVIVLVLFYGIVLYNKLVDGRSCYKNAFAQIDAQLARQHDLIPNQIETANGYLKHVRKTWEVVINARNIDLPATAGRMRSIRKARTSPRPLSPGRSRSAKTTSGPFSSRFPSAPPLASASLSSRSGETATPSRSKGIASQRTGGLGHPQTPHRMRMRAAETSAKGCRPTPSTSSDDGADDESRISMNS